MASKFFIYSAASISPVHQAETDEDQSVGGRAWAMDLFGCIGYAKCIISGLLVSTKHQKLTTNLHKTELLGPQNGTPGIFDTFQGDIA